ncbi:hypothetical protein D1007_40605 [Hordeum vulgare]|nr:hypothetical protein D1007_40605 [Hordeum vulgare]
MEFDMHLVETHMRKMDLTVVYTNDPVMVEDSINTMEWLLVEDGKYKVVSFDPYNGGHVEHDQKLVIAQLYMHHHVLLYHYCLATVPCERFTRFVNNPRLQKLVDMRGHYKIWGSKKDMDSHVDLVEAIIDPYYGGMKAECDKNKHV